MTALRSHNEEDSYKEDDRKRERQREKDREREGDTAREREREREGDDYNLSKQRVSRDLVLVTVIKKIETES